MPACFNRASTSFKPLDSRPKTCGKCQSREMGKAIYMSILSTTTLSRCKCRPERDDLTIATSFMAWKRRNRVEVPLGTSEYNSCLSNNIIQSQSSLWDLYHLLHYILPYVRFVPCGTFQSATEKPRY